MATTTTKHTTTQPPYILLLEERIQPPIPTASAPPNPTPEELQENNCVTFCLLMLLIICTLKIGMYECYVGGIGANLVIKYGTDLTIENVPFDLMSDTKTYASSYIGCGAGGIIILLVSVLYFFIYRNHVSSEACLITGLIISNIAVCIAVVPAVLTVSDLNAVRRDVDAVDLWNKIDPDIIGNMYRSESVMYMTLVPACLWSVLCSCILMIARTTSP